jgi:hypothetical protein
VPAHAGPASRAADRDTRAGALRPLPTTGTIADDRALLPAMEPLVWASFDGGKERGLIAVRFLDRVR